VFSVSTVLMMLAKEGSTERLVERVPELESADIHACLHFAATQLDQPVSVAVPLSMKLTLAALLASCTTLMWVLASPDAPTWVLLLAIAGTVIGIWSTVSARFPLHGRRARGG
jgi:uncharacterized membrane protein